MVSSLGIVEVQAAIVGQEVARDYSSYAAALTEPLVKLTFALHSKY